MAKKLEKAQKGKIVKAAAKAAVKSSADDFARKASSVHMPRSVGTKVQPHYNFGAPGRAADNKTRALMGATGIGMGAAVVGSSGGFSSGSYGKESKSDTTKVKKKMGGAFDKYKSKKK